MDSLPAVRIRAYQMLVSYRRPGSFIIRETYPLPPYSTVIGMVHAVCGFTEYVPMRVSVQGDYTSSLSEPYTHYSFNRGMKFDHTRHNIPIRYEGEKYGMTRGLQHIELLTDVELLLHILPEEGHMAEIIAHGLRYPREYPSLGRREDLLRIDEAAVTGVSLRVLEASRQFEYSAYMPVEPMREASAGGTKYRLNKRFNTDGNTRKWEQVVTARFTGKGDYFNVDEMDPPELRSVWMDTEGNMVFPA